MDMLLYPLEHRLDASGINPTNPNSKETTMAYQTINPPTGKLVKTYANHTKADIEAALDAAHKLYKSPWSKDIKPRLQVLNRLADLIDARKEELAKIVVEE